MAMSKVSRTPASKILQALEAVTLASMTKEKGTSRTGQVEGRSQRAQLLVALLPEGGPSSLGNAELSESRSTRKVLLFFLLSSFFLFFFFLNEVNEDSFYSCSTRLIVQNSREGISVVPKFPNDEFQSSRCNSLGLKSQVVIFLKRFQSLLGFRLILGFGDDYLVLLQVLKIVKEKFQSISVRYLLCSLKVLEVDS